jgi:hypothetical protein
MLGAGRSIGNPGTAPRALFKNAFELREFGLPVHNFDVDPKNQRLLFVKGKKVEDPEPVREIQVILNWAEELKELVPVD